MIDLSFLIRKIINDWNLPGDILGEHKQCDFEKNVWGVTKGRNMNPKSKPILKLWKHTLQTYCRKFCSRIETLIGNGARKTLTFVLDVVSIKSSPLEGFIGN